MTAFLKVHGLGGEVYHFSEEFRKLLFWLRVSLQIIVDDIDILLSKLGDLASN